MSQLQMLNGSGTPTPVNPSLATTIGAVTADIITIPLAATSATYQLSATVKGFEGSGPAGAGYEVFATVRTDGVTATLIGNQDIFNEDASLAAADAYFTVSGNSAILQVLGVALLTINWEATASML